jgi:hypothetical protein
MKVLLNGLEIRGGDTELPTVGEILDQLRSEIGEKGKVVTAIAVDGELLQDDPQREEVEGRPPSEVERIELTVEEPRSLLAKGLSDTRDFLQSLRGDLTKTATAFRLGDEFTANNNFAGCLDDLKLVLTGMNAAARLPGVEAETAPLRQTLISSNTRLVPMLDTMYKAQAACDYVTLADGIEYDLTEIADEWIGVLNHILRDAMDEDTVVAR